MLRKSGFWRADGKYVGLEEFNLNPVEGTLTVDGKSNVVELSGPCVVSLSLVHTAVSASDTNDVTVETSPDGTTWHSAGAFTQATETENAAWVQAKEFLVDRYVRLDFNVGGTGVSIDCTCSGKARA
jgi:hypothetical protein